ncbi:hypothetical protein DITRI_Ditri14bG0079300 [Diplodiscus trichospermus]
MEFQQLSQNVVGSVSSDKEAQIEVSGNNLHLPLQGTVLLALRASLDSLRPQPCETGSSLCQSLSKLQLPLFCIAIVYVEDIIISWGLGFGLYVVMVTILKRNVQLSSKIKDYYQENDGRDKIIAAMLEGSFRYTIDFAPVSSRHCNSAECVLKSCCAEN